MASATETPLHGLSWGYHLIVPVILKAILSLLHQNPNLNRRSLWEARLAIISSPTHSLAGVLLFIFNVLIVNIHTPFQIVLAGGIYIWAIV